MPDRPDKPDEQAYAFLQRWSQRKHQQQHAPEPQTSSEDITSEDPPPPIREADLPPIESLHEDSEVSMFMQKEISETLRRQALRKLFHLGKFNVIDGLDDYADDYSVFEPLRGVLDIQQQLHKLSKKMDQSKTQATNASNEQTTEATADTPAVDVTDANKDGKPEES
jgi:hypothetical protein